MPLPSSNLAEVKTREKVLVIGLAVWHRATQQGVSSIFHLAYTLGSSVQEKAV